MKELETVSLENSRPVIIKLFKQLDEQKKVNKTRAALLDKIRAMSPYMNIPEGFEKFILELYVLNFRDDGDYSNLTKDNFVDPRKQPGKTTPNTKSYEYTIAQLPFKGSNLRGFWERDGKGGNQYVVESYGWYPLFIFKNGSWYQITDSYSSSTGKQISNANPVAWSEDLNHHVTLLTRDEIKDLRRGKDPEEIKREKVQRLKNREEELVKAKKTTVTTWSDWNIRERPPTKIKFKINKIDIEDGKAVMTIDVYDVLKKDKTGKGVATPENYTKGELPHITKEFVENSIKNKLMGKLREYVGHRFNWYQGLTDIHNIRFNFNHLRENQ